MSRLVRTALLACALAAGPLLSPALAQAPELPPPNPKVKIDYLEPRDPGPTAVPQARAAFQRFTAIRDRMVKREVLENFARFMAPLNLPVALRVRLQECGVVNAFYDPSEWAIKICYEFVDALEQGAPKGGEAHGFTRQEGIVGGFLMVLLHEAGHALSDIFELPVLGREEDSADQLAAFVMLQFGPEVARTAVKGAAYFWLTSWGAGDVFPHFDTHSTGQQRAATFLCIAYGGDPARFKDLVEARWLTKERAEGCTREYQQIRLAFRKTMLPHLNEKLVEQVRQVPWLRAEDGAW